MLTGEQKQRIERLFAGWTADAPGGSLALLSQGAVIYQRCFGLANLEHGIPVTEATRFHIASITKTFCAAACALLHHQRRLDLDADVRDYVPELRPQSPVKVRHLLNMISGLRDSMESMIVRGIWYRYPRSSQDLLDLVFAQGTQSYPTATRCVYTNINFNLLALIVERISGKKFDEFLAEAFWRPLGMADTLLRDSNTIPVPRLADAYIPVPGGWEKGTWAFGLSGAGGLVSTVGDLIRWHGMFRAGGVDGAPIARLMAEPGVLADEVRTHYGLGLGLRPYRGVTVQCHGGGLPGYKAMFARVPERDFALVLLTNRDDTDSNARLRDIIDICLGDSLPPAAPFAGGMAVNPATLGGRYLDRASGEPIDLAFDAASSVLKFDKLGTALSLRPVTADSYADGWANFVTTLRVEPRKNGRPNLYLDFGGQRGLFEPIDSYAPAQDDLVSCIGRYRNANMRSEAEVEWRGGDLVLRFGPAFHQEAELALAPLARDIFFTRYDRPWTKQAFAVRFVRHGDSVAGILVSSDRLKDTWFARF